MQHQHRRRLLGQQIPWQISVGAALCLTVICCAKQRRSRGKRRTGSRSQAAAPATQQALRAGVDDLAELKQEGKGSAAQCQLPLLRVTLIDEALNCSVKQLWSIICKPDAAFQATIHRLSGNRDIQYGGWHQQDGCLVREEQYINPLKKNSLGPNEAFCIDQQQCLHRSTAGFVLERKVFTPKVPFGGSFHNLVRWCAWAEQSTGKVRLQVSCDVIFTKRWVPVKNIINSSSIEGLERFYKMWRQQVQHHLQLHRSPSQSAATVSPSRHPRTALKKGSVPVTWSLDAVLPWLTLLVMTVWLLYQSGRQAQGYGSLDPMFAWSKNNTVFPGVVPLVVQPAMS